MRKPKMRILSLVGIGIMISFLVSCSSTPATEVSTSPPGETGGTTVNTTSQGESETQTVGSEGTGANIPDIPEDIPIMPGARNIAITQDGSNISYEVDGVIDDVVSFYQDQLPNYGWEMTRSPDNALGSMATMARVNEEGDRITFSLQYNPMGEFVVIRIVRLMSQ